jgi:MFS family permease
MQAARARWSVETVVSTAVAILGTTMVMMANAHSLPALMPIMLVSGGAWITFISLANALVQILAPDWVRARVLAIFMLITQGGLAAGSALWGTIGSRASVDSALTWAGLATIATIALRFVARLPDSAADVSPWNHWRMPAIVEDAIPALEQGPVLVTVTYRVAAPNTRPFLHDMNKYQRIRRRDGASRWGIYRDLEQADVYVETFLVTSWAEHLRQHERLTRGDGELEQRIRSHTSGEPVVRHLIYADAR